MRIFKNKKLFMSKKEIIMNLEKHLHDKTVEIEKLKEQLGETNKIACDSLSKVMADNTKLKDELAKTKKLNQKIGYAKGGLTKRNNELIAENTELAFKLTELKKEFENFKKNKFIVKEIKAQKVPKSTQKMSMRSGTKTSKIISKVKPTETDEIGV